MSLTLAIAVYFIIWWLVLFIVLPLGVRDQHEAGEVVPGTPASAPANPRLVRIAVLTTILSAVVLAVVYGVIASGVIDGAMIDRVFGIKLQG